jgi:flagellar biosynthetic protein FliO
MEIPFLKSYNLSLCLLTPLEPAMLNLIFSLLVIPPEDHFTRDMLNMLSTLGIVVAVLYGLAYAIKRMMNNRVQQLNTSSLIKVVEQRSLSPKSTLYLVEVHGKTIVLGESVNGVTLLTTLRPLPEGENPPLQ